MSLSPDEIKALLHLERHPTCGFVAPTYRSPIMVPATSLRSEYGSERPIGSALYFLVTPDAHIVMHRIRSDQQYHHYLGDPLDLIMLLPDGTGQLATVGNDLRRNGSTTVDPRWDIPYGPPETGRKICAVGQYGMARCRPSGR